MIIAISFNKWKEEGSGRFKKNANDSECPNATDNNIMASNGTCAALT